MKLKRTLTDKATRHEVRLPRLGPRSGGMLLEPKEFDAVTDYDGRYSYELVRGVVIVNPIPREAESDPNEELGHWLRNYKESHVITTQPPAQGSALDKTLPERYVRTSDSRRKADRVIWAGLGCLPDPEVDTPAIVVELVSKSRRDWLRDYEEKRREYRAVGVKEYWVTDRFRRTLTVYRVDGTEKLVAEKETYTTDLLPGFTMPLAALLKVADEWGK